MLGHSGICEEQEQLDKGGLWRGFRTFWVNRLFPKHEFHEKQSILQQFMSRKINFINVSEKCDVNSSDPNLRNSF